MTSLSIKYASTPQAKGKVERAHQFWQKRLPSYFSAEAITDISQANTHIQELRIHHNQGNLRKPVSSSVDGVADPVTCGLTEAAYKVSGGAPNMKPIENSK